MPTNKDVAREFVAGRRSQYHSNNMRIDGEVLYSYATAVAIRMPSCILISDERYSNTTSKQLGQVRGEAIRAGVRTFRVPVRNVGRTHNPIATGHDCLAVTVREWNRRVKQASEEWRNCPSAKVSRKAKLKRELDEISSKLKQFMAYFGLDYAECGISDWE